MMKRPLVFTLALGLVGGTAAADRHARASSVFDGKCAGCHLVGWGAEVKPRPPSRVDLTLAAVRHDEAWLRAWLHDPRLIKEKTQCRTDGLDRVQIDLLVGFLEEHARPLARKVVIPPAQGRTRPETPESAPGGQK
jgi:hypothetical protein